MKFMKMNILYQSGEHIEFRFDDGVRKIFVAVAELAREFTKDPQVRRSAENTGSSVQEDWAVGLDALNRLAHVLSKVIHLKPTEGICALNLISVASHYQVDRKRSLSDLISCLLALGQGCPCQINCPGLPPADHL